MFWKARTYVFGSGESFEGGFGLVLLDWFQVGLKHVSTWDVVGVASTDSR